MTKPLARVLGGLGALVLLVPGAAAAMPGFYAGSGDAKLVNRSSHVVVMREGTRTVITVQPDYEGPVADVAIVIPVPETIRRENVRTIPREVLARIDRLDAPRLVEYWEADPCASRPRDPGGDGGSPVDDETSAPVAPEAPRTEYSISTIAARDFGAFDAWLRREKLKVPPGVEGPLRSVLERGAKLLVARIDASKLEMKQRGERRVAVLPPLRFHFDSETFRVPLHIGVLSSGGIQDVIVHVLGRSRYEPANVVGVAVPTNLTVSPSTRDAFASFYATLFDRTSAAVPGAAVIEYAWDARTCDACTTRPLDDADLLALGADVLPSVSSEVDLVDPQLLAALGADAGGARRKYHGLRSFVLTRIHLRYPREAAEDLYLKEAAPISGGSEPAVRRGAAASVKNAFQARYAVRHRWTAPVTCAVPVHGVWAGQPGGVPSPAPRPALDLASVPRDAPLITMLANDVPELGITAAQAPAPASAAPASAEAPAKRGCSGCAIAAPLGAILYARRRRKR